MLVGKPKTAVFQKEAGRSSASYLLFAGKPFVFVDVLLLGEQSTGRAAVCGAVATRGPRGETARRAHAGRWYDRIGEALTYARSFWRVRGCGDSNGAHGSFPGDFCGGRANLAENPHK